MKVTLTKEAKQYLTIAEAPAARQIILDEKEDTTTATEYVKQAADLVCAHRYRRDVLGSPTVLQAKAEIVRYCDAYDRFFDGSGKLDVYVSGVVKTLDSFITIGVHLSDLWMLDDRNGAEIAALVDARVFKEVKL